MIKCSMDEYEKEKTNMKENENTGHY
jgi:hypothetical protein